MSALDAYEKRVLTLMSPPQAAQDTVVGAPLVVGFDWSSVFSLVLSALLPMLTNCLGPKTPAEMAAKLVEKGMFVRLRALEAVSKACKDCDVKISASERSRLAKATLDGLGTKQEAIAVMAELKAESEWGV